MNLLDLSRKGSIAFYAHNPSIVNFPLDSEDYAVDESELDLSTLKECLYYKLESDKKPMQYNNGIERAMTRLLACWEDNAEEFKDFRDYCAFGVDANENFYAEYCDCTNEEFQTIYNSGNPDFSKTRKQIFKIDKHGKLSACVISNTGAKTKLTLDIKPNAMMKNEKHSPSGIIFALTAYMLYGYHNSLITGDVPAIITKHFYELANSYELKKDDLASWIRVVDNDLYELFKNDSKVIDNIGSLPFLKSEVEKTEYPILKDSDIKCVDLMGHSSILSGGRVSSKGIKRASKTIKEIMDSPEFVPMELSMELTEEEKSLIPKLDDFVPSKKVLDIYKTIQSTHKTDNQVNNLLLVGEAGSGKSTSVQMLAKLSGLPYRFQNVNPDTTAGDLLVNIIPNGSKNEVDVRAVLESMPSAYEIALDPVDSYLRITGEYLEDATELDCQVAINNAVNASGNQSDFIHVPSPFVTTFEHGGYLEFMEITNLKPGEMTGLNSALDKVGAIVLPDGRVVKRHPDCIIVMTANIDYEGCRPINQSVLSRCHVMQEFDLPTDEELIEMIKKNTGYSDEDVIERMLMAQKAIRKVLEENGANDGVCGVREVQNWATITKVLGDPYDAAMMTIVPLATKDKDIHPEVVVALETQFTRSAS